MARICFRIPLPIQAALLLLLVASSLQAEENNYAEIQPLAERSLLLDITTTGKAWLTVGERGHILKSSDGENWRQIENVPSRATLTAVFALGEKVWAVGHDSTILHSSDGGESWVSQYRDDQGDAFMAVRFLTPRHGFAMGAYGLLMETRNGGQDWEFIDLNTVILPAEFEDQEETGADSNDYAAALEDEGCYETLECHLNAMVDMGNQRLLIVGEKGYGYRSRDNGKSWQAVRLPYDGSMFGAIALSKECVLAFGLRGHAFRSCDLGDSWEEVETGTESSLFGAARGRRMVVMVGANGVMLRGPMQSLKMKLEVLDSDVDYTGIVSAGRERAFLSSTGGIRVYQPGKGGEK